MRLLFISTGVLRAWRAPAAALLVTAIGCGSTGDTASSSSAGQTSGGVITGAGGGGSGTGGQGGIMAASSSGAGGAGGSVVLKGPPYPIVLSHGFFGFEKFAGVDFVTYFYGVKKYLHEQGETLVFTPAVDPFNTSDFRGQQLADYIEQLLKNTGYAKVNIIGHSQGGLDARVVANLRPDLVASVVTVSTPHGGSKIADVVLKLVADPNYQKVISDLLNLIGAPLYDQIGNETDVFKPLKLFSQPGITAFNQAHPDEPGVFYASIAGRTDLSIGGDVCDADVKLPFIQDFSDTVDPVDPMLSLFDAILDETINNPYANDGMVRVKDAKRGQFWGCIPADHLDEVGQLLGDSPGLGNSWDHKAFYAAIVAELRKRGF